MRGTLIPTVLLSLVFLSAPAAADDLRPRADVIKPARTVLKAWHRDDVISVKFVDGLTVRLRDGVLSDLGTGDLAQAERLLAAMDDGAWHRAVAAVPETDLDRMRQTAQARLGRVVADFNTRFHYEVPADGDAAAIIDALNALDIVELAEPAPMSPPAPVAPNFQWSQAYMNAGPVGLNAYAVWEQYGAKGAGVSVAVVDYNWNASHADLPAVTLLGAAPPAGYPKDHTTAALGVIGALDDGIGTTGMAHQATLFFAGAELMVGASPVWDVGAAILTALASLQPGDVILIEQQWFGPNWDGSNGTCPGQFGLVPVEWRLNEYNAIVTAVGQGVTVIEPAGNGDQDLDDPVYSTGNGGHWPFLPANDSGAIMVGAGAAPVVPGSGIPVIGDVDRSRLTCSNYGSTVDVQGWGEGIFTTGYGDAWGFGGTNEWYTKTFGGTSGASAMMAAAAALVQSEVLAVGGAPLTPGSLLGALQFAGEPQQSGTNPLSENIGPRPDTAYALAAIFGNCLPRYDTTVGATGVDDRINAMITFDDGGGDDLYVAGKFANAGGALARKVARWDGANWSAVGSELVGGEIQAIAAFDDGGGAQLYVGGWNSLFGAGPTAMANFNGTSWTAIPGINHTPTSNPRVHALEVFDDGNGDDLYVGGLFDDAGGNAAGFIAGWDGTNWSTVGTGMNHQVRALTVHDDGNGDALYAGGLFTTAGGNAANRVAKWDGSTWTALGAGLPDIVYDMISFDDGGGAALYVAGGGSGGPSAYMARWDGTTWTGLGSGTGGTTFALAVYNDGICPALYAAGTFTSAGDKWSNRIAKWNGTEWFPLGDGLSGSANALTVFDPGGGPSLFVGGDFPVAWDLPVSNVAEWDGCPVPCTADTNGDSAVDVNDLVAVITGWGVCPPPCPADINCDGVIDVNDLVLVITQWGACP